MRVYEELQKYKLNDKYKRNGIKCFFDESRKIFVQATPEEKVRQQIILYLQEKLNVPKDKISTEVNFKDLGSKSRKRMDIVIDAVDDIGKYPVAVIECKSNNICLTDEVFYQATGYADEAAVNYVFTTNGIDLFAYYYNEDDEKYYELTKFPTYEDMVYENTTKDDFNEIEEFARIPYEKLFDLKYIKENDIDYKIGVDTPDKFKPFIMNLGDCLLDISRQFPLGRYGDISVVEDRGIRYITYGNASGGSYNNYYRTLIIKDKNGNNQLISFCIQATFKDENDPAWKNIPGRSYLSVAIDDFDKKHHSLQLNMNKFLAMVDDEVTIKHNGAIAIGNIGSGKISELKKFIKKQYPELLNDFDEIVLGKIKNDKLLYVDNDDVRDLIINLIKYALVRDEYRAYVKKLNKK